MQGHERQTAFYEGCWPGDALGADFDGSADFFGSGGFVDAEGVRLSSSTHTLDAVFVAFAGLCVAASNSLPLLLRFARIDTRRLTGLPDRVRTVFRGLGRIEPVLHEEPGLRIERLVFGNARLHADRIERFAKPRLPRFDTFEDYRDHVSAVLAATARNAAVPRRRVRYEPLATVSSGYDSSASAALAARLGCREALSLRSARFHLDDNGAKVASSLGMACIELDRPADAARRPMALDAEFLAGFCPGDCTFSAFDGLIRRRLLFTGHHGDKAWAMAGDDAAVFKRSGGGSGMGLHEMRLRNDCLLSIAFWEWRFSPATVRAADRFARGAMSPAALSQERVQRWFARALHAGSHLRWGDGRGPGARPQRFLAARIRDFSSACCAMHGKA